MTSFTYDGDIEEASQWLPFAVAQQATLKQLGIASNVISPEQDVTIMIRTRPEHVHIIVGGGTYHFIVENDDGSFSYYLGKLPISGDPENFEIALTTAKPFNGSPAALSVAGAPESDRHTWYGKIGNDTITVLSGYGARYATNRVPHTGMTDPGGGGLFLGNVAVYRNGKHQFTAPFTAFNAVLLNGVVIGLQTNGAIKFCLLGNTEFQYEASIAGLTLPEPTATDFIAVQPAIRDSNGSGDYVPYEHRYVSHSKASGFDQLSCYWSFSPDGTKMVGVNYVNYAVLYHGYATEDFGEYEAGDRVPSQDKTDTEVVAYLVEVSLEAGLDESGEPYVTAEATDITMMPFYTQQQMLVAADFYYYPPKNPDPQAPNGGRQDYEPEQNELILLFAERFNYRAADMVYVNEFGLTVYVESDNASLVIANKAGTEYVRDMFNYNSALATFSQDESIEEWIDGRVLAVDLRCCSYMVQDGRNSATYPDPYAGHRVIFRGASIYSASVASGVNATSDTIGAYIGLMADDPNTSNIWRNVWDAFKLDRRLVANPFDDCVLMTYKGSIGAEQYVMDVFINYVVEINDLGEAVGEYKPVYQFHTLSSGVTQENDGVPLAGNVWII